MYVLCFCIGDGSCVYFDFLESGCIHYSADISKAMLFLCRSDAMLMAGLVSHLVYNLDFVPSVIPVTVDDEDLLNDDVWFMCEYFCDD